MIAELSAIPWLSPLRHQFEHLASGVSSRGDRRARRPKQRRDDARIDRGTAAGHPPDAADELRDVADAVLEQVARALSGIGEQFHREPSSTYWEKTSTAVEG